MSTCNDTNKIMAFTLIGMLFGALFTLLIFTLATPHRETQIVRGKQFMLNNATYKCTKTNELVVD